MFVCTNCGARYKSLPSVTYTDGSGGSMIGKVGCTGCASGVDSLKEE